MSDWTFFTIDKANIPVGMYNIRITGFLFEVVSGTELSDFTDVFIEFVDPCQLNDLVVADPNPFASPIKHYLDEG